MPNLAVPTPNLHGTVASSATSVGVATQAMHATVAHLASGAGVATQKTIKPGTAMAVTSTTTAATSSASDVHKLVTAPPVNKVPNDVPESSIQGAPKSKGKPYCHRCHTKGHTIFECTAILSCDICYGDHVTKVCQNLKKL
jgi:hypothetical protein